MVDIALATCVFSSRISSPLRTEPRELTACAGVGEDVFTTDFGGFELPVGNVDQKKDTLESLIRTGTFGKCYLYYKAGDPPGRRGVRARIGDKHSPQSLLTLECLPRLIDSLLEEHPPFYFPKTSVWFSSPERLQHERALGYEPRGLRRFWQSPGKKGKESPYRYDVEETSEEFVHVQGIFHAEPSVERFYCPRTSGTHAAGRDVMRIERIENGILHETMDTVYGGEKQSLKGMGIDPEGGIHTRYLFHGTSSAEALQSILEDPRNGFNALLGKDTVLWGDGIYFARDATYSWGAGYTQECCDEDEHEMILLCLVATGIPCVGVQGLSNIPKIHPKSFRYGCLVDCPSNPEIFVVQNGTQAYPAYIIHFS